VEFQASCGEESSCIWSPVRFHKKQDLARTGASCSALVLFSMKIIGASKIISRLDANLRCAHLIHCSVSMPSDGKEVTWAIYDNIFLEKLLFCGYCHRRLVYYNIKFNRNPACHQTLADGGFLPWISGVVSNKMHDFLSKRK